MIVVIVMKTTGNWKVASKYWDENKESMYLEAQERKMFLRIDARSIKN